jgi:DnaJ domain
MLAVTACGIIRNSLVWFLLTSPCWVVLAGCSQPTEIEREEWENYGIETERKRYKPQYSSDYNYKSRYSSRYKPQYSSNYNYNSRYSSRYKPQYSSNYNYNSQYSSSHKPQDSSNYNSQYSSSHKPQDSSNYNYNSQYGSRYKPQDSSDYYNYKSQQDREEKIKSELTPHYDTLGLPYGASLKEIKKAYHKLARRCHPDKNPNDTAAATKEFQKIREAYSQLADAHTDGQPPATE